MFGQSDTTPSSAHERDEADGALSVTWKTFSKSPRDVFALQASLLLKTVPLRRIGTLATNELVPGKVEPDGVGAEAVRSGRPFTRVLHEIGELFCPCGKVATNVAVLVGVATDA
ncbi:hypothetical protein COU76_00040 [Candidatus Peregrinibacteria bacterium CG10_big_fil_rev_8_21_14_0_10_49_10]|nr:MAG: hypothetical protein COU76_00040 [Candidatus Peregrinibacteria bacterium CG10_big_fil_rev_8_21_14_0_10_49_10]